MPKHIKIIMWAVILFTVFSTISSVTTSLVSKGSSIYNQSVVFKSKYALKEQEQVSNFDMQYLEFQEKKPIADLNKEAFVQVTQIIMSNRKDGENLAWKWTQENTQIPYEQFTDLYKDLYAFASKRYQDQLHIEMEKQGIANEHNVMLQTFPNNLFNNYYLHIPTIQYKHGFVTDSTSKLFKLNK